MTTTGLRAFFIIRALSVILSITILASLSIITITQLTTLRLPALIIASTVGLLLADFASGIIHWLADTWGNKRTPIIGEVIIGSFRDHHRDQLGITRHSFFEVNGDLSLGLIIPELIVLYFTLQGSISFFLLSLLTALCIAIQSTNSIHKWAHQEKVHPVIRFAQRTGLLLSPQAHKKHHTTPHTSDYCITTGWLNKLLQKLRFFEKLETIITRITRAQPRSN